jgi:hypothetical protein
MMRSRSSLAPAVILALALSIGLSVNRDARAAVEPLDDAVLDRMIAASESVVVATPRSVRPAWQQNEHGDQIIVSTVLLDVTETLKGRAEGARRVEIEGGTIDGVTLEVSDEPVVEPGVRAIFFLRSKRADADRPSAGELGVLPLDESGRVHGRDMELETVRRRIRHAGQESR